MVLLIIIPFLNGYNFEYTLFSDKPIWLIFYKVGEHNSNVTMVCGTYNYSSWGL